MNKLKLMLRSKTFWTLVVTLVFNVVSVLSGEIPNYVVLGANIFLTVMATYFKIIPSQNYNPITPTPLNNINDIPSEPVNNSNVQNQ